MRITEDDLSSPEVVALLEKYLDSLSHRLPPGGGGSRLDELKTDDTTVWTAWRDGKLAGCGALKELDASHGEIKAMRTSRAFLGQGVASAILRHLIGEARGRGYKRLSLEHGSGPGFVPAQSLFGKFGFEYCGPFGDYTEDPACRYMTLEL